MATKSPVKTKIKNLKVNYNRFARGKESLLKIIDESEIPEKCALDKLEINLVSLKRYEGPD